MSDKHLVCDIGNTKGKFAIISNNEILESWNYDTTNIAENFDKSLEKYSYPVALSSVVPEVSECIRTLCQKHERPLYEVGPLNQNILSGMNKEMGADRVASAVGAYCIYGKRKHPTIVMTFGTATTILAISAKGEVVGGLIHPGLGLLLEALYSRCALLPHIEISGAHPSLGFDTTTHISHGALLGHIGLIKEWLTVSRNTLGNTADIVTIATGGWDIELEKHCQLFDTVDQELTLKGISLLAESEKSIGAH